MASNQWLLRQISSTPTTAARFFSIAHGKGNTAQITEANAQAPMPSAGNLKTLKVLLSGTPGSGKSIQVQVSINGTPNATMSVTISDTSTSGVATGTVAVSAGDLVTYKVTPSGTPTARAAEIWLEFEPTTADNFGYPAIWSWNGTATVASADPPVYAPLFSGGNGNTSTGLGLSRDLSPLAGDIVSFYVALGTAPGVGKSWTVIVEKNGSEIAGTSITISGTNKTGNLTGLTEAIAIGDELAFKVKTASGGPASTRIGWGVTVVPDNTGEWLLAGTDSGNPSTSVATYLAPGYNISGTNTTESNEQLTAPTDLAIKAIVAAMVTAPASGKSWTYRSRIAGGNGSLNFAVSDAATAGSATGSDSVAADDLIDMSVTPSGTPTNMGGHAWAMALAIGPETISPTGDIAPTGALSKVVSIGLSGSLTSGGGLLLGNEIELAGSVTSSGSLRMSVSAGLEGSIEPSGELVAHGIAFRPQHPGESHVLIYTPDGTLFKDDVTPLNYKISRYTNQVGRWTCEIPVDGYGDSGDGDQVVALTVGAGWKVSIYQDDSYPNHTVDVGYLLYQGIIETREFRITAGGQSTLYLTGSFKDLALVRRSTRKGYTYEGTLTGFAQYVVDTTVLTDGIAIPAAASSAQVKVEFNDLSKYAALVKGATLARYSVRESWDNDRLELTAYDGPPNPGIILAKYNEDTHGDRYAPGIMNGTDGIGLIAGTPRVRYDGSALVNRIIAYGVDTVADPEGDPGDTMDADLTLAHASLSSPYAVQSAVDEGGNTYYYIEDSESIARYGLIEWTMWRTDIKNPNDDGPSRTQAGNVLYMTAVNELIKRRSEKVFFEIGPIANGHHIWLLPGDQTWAQYQGEVELVSGNQAWIDIQKRFLVVERHDNSDPSGIRRVEFVLAAPEMEFPVPGLPEAIDPFTDLPIPEISLPPIPPTPDVPGIPETGGGNPAADPCCADPTTSEEGGPEDDFEEKFDPGGGGIGGGGGGEFHSPVYFNPASTPIPANTQAIFMMIGVGEGGSFDLTTADITETQLENVVRTYTYSQKVSGVWQDPVSTSPEYTYFWLEVTGASPTIAITGSSFAAEAYAIRASGAVELIEFGQDKTDWSLDESSSSSFSASFAFGPASDELMLFAPVSARQPSANAGPASSPTGWTTFYGSVGETRGFWTLGPSGDPETTVNVFTNAFRRVGAGYGQFSAIVVGFA